jgi:WD40 repeat protein
MAVFVHSLWIALLALTAAPVLAGDPPPAPVLRVDTGTHTSMIRRIVVDHANHRVITAGDDKTARIWQMPEQRLVRTLRVPIDSGHEGQIFALAVSPDGRRVALGGWTGWDWDGQASVYLFDTASGELDGRFDGFRDAIHALAWSPDGRFLAVGLQGRAGLSVRRLEDGVEIAQDTQYRDKLTDLDFSPDGRLVAASLDGYVRLYDESLQLIGRRIVPGGSQPLVVRYSADGRHIAVGFYDAPGPSVILARNLELAYQPDASGIELQRVLAVGWAADGSALFAGGDRGKAGDNAVYRWTDAGRGPRQRIAAARERIAEIQPLGGGKVVFAAEDPGFGIIDEEGQLQRYRTSDLVDFSTLHGHLLVSADGDTVSYPLTGDGPRQSVFSLSAGADQQPAGRAAPVPLSAPRRDAPGWTLVGLGSARVAVNGRMIAVDDYEVVHNHAISAAGDRLLLGTEWALRMIDLEGRQLWTVKLAAVVRAVNISGDGRTAVAALSDGTVRWFSMADGRELLAWFAHRNGRDWIAWNPAGFYMSSVYGDNHVGWHINRGRDTTPDFFHAVQFDRVLYRPDIVVKALADEPGADSAPMDLARLSEIAPPRVRVMAGPVQKQERGALLELILQGEMGAAPTQDVAVYVNGLPVTPGNQRLLNDSESRRFDRRVRVPLYRRENQIRVEAFNGLSMGVDETYVALPEADATEPLRGDLYVLAVGVNHFPNLPEDIQLDFAVQDAEQIVSYLGDRGSGVYRQVHTRLITDATDEKPLGNVIERNLEFVKQARGDDTVVVFLASHGISDTQGNYYFVPRDATVEDLRRLSSGGEIATLLPWTTFFNGLRMAAGRRLLIVDTCQAANIEGRFESHSFMKRSAASLFSLMLASKGGEYSQEDPETGHGLFTYSLLESIRRNPDRNNDGLLTQEELFASAALIVDARHDREVGPQTPQLVAPEPLGNTPLVATGSR